MKLLKSAICQLFLLFIVASGIIYAQPYSSKERQFAIIPSNTRFVKDLSGNWERSFNNEDWETVYVPNSSTNKKRVYFRKNLQIDDKMLNNYSWSLYFLGVDDQVEIYLNNQLVGRYFGGLTPFWVQIPHSIINPGTNKLQIIVSPTTDAAKIIKEQYLFAKKQNAGLIREVLLVGSPQVWVNSVKNKLSFTENMGTAYVSSAVTLSSGQIKYLLQQANYKDSTLNYRTTSRANVNVDVQIRRKSTGEYIASAGSQNVDIETERSITLNFSATVYNPLLWTPTDPNLYEVYVKITKNGQLIDDYSSTVGFYSLKSIHSDNAMILVNNNPFLIKGIDYIEDYIQSGQTLSPERMEADVQLLKTLGANVIRFKYAVPHPYLMYLCDKYGIFVMTELPLNNVPSSLLSLYETQSRLKNVTERLIMEYNEHPSLFAYCVSDGIIEGNSKVEEILKQYVKILKKETNKLICKTVWFGSKSINTDGFDMIGLRDSHKFTSLEQLTNEVQRLRSLTKKLPVFICYGQVIQPENENGYTDPMTIEAQRYYMLNVYHMVKNLNLSGSVFWAFNDYELNNPFLLVNNQAEFLCSCGILSRDRQQRLSFSTLQGIFTGMKEEPILNAGSYTSPAPMFFVIVGLVVGLIIFVLINRFKRFREYIFRALMRPYNFYADIRDQRIMSLPQTYLLATVLSITVGLLFASIFYVYRSNETAQYIYMLFIPGDFLKEIFYKLVWMPEIFSLIIAATMMLLLHALSLILRVFSLFVRGRIFFGDTFTISTWSCSPIIILLPLAMILVRLLVFMPYIFGFVLILTILIALWVFFRILKATAVVFDIPISRSYLIGGSMMAVILVTSGLIYNINNYIFAFSKYLIQFLAIVS